ncbi:hypothetical protein [Paenibacillus silvae]|uniref:Uncharacterized protein n=1 Tax=Paenibacillus silvae TaxID=1325358 RepID=A0A2W6NNH9_9BACL|nr:hypothetical protein [Paenibacillus silvae]PZT57419.1 hypothetical protein DN757_01825 [Paenibacillus silvae]
MEKFKEFIKKVKNKFSTPVKPLAVDVFEEEKKIEINENSIELGNFKIASNGDIQISNDSGINLSVTDPEDAACTTKDVKPIIKWRNPLHEQVTTKPFDYGVVEGEPHKEAQFFVWSNKKDDVLNKLYKIKDRTKNKRIKNKIQKQIDAYRQQRTEKDVLVTGKEYMFRYWNSNSENDEK